MHLVRNAHFLASDQRNSEISICRFDLEQVEGVLFYFVEVQTPFSRADARLLLVIVVVVVVLNVRRKRTTRVVQQYHQFAFRTTRWSVSTLARMAGANAPD